MKFLILASKGSFLSIQEAAFSEKQVDWWDASDKKAVVCTECFAAVELCNHLRRIGGGVAGEDIRLADAGEAVLPESGGETAVLIGNSMTNPCIGYLEKETGMSLSADERVVKEGYRIKSFRYRDTGYVILSGKDRAGTLHAVYAFLEILGVRWFAPGEKGTCYPEALPLEIAETDLAENPAFTTRGGYSEYLDDSCEELIAWVAHNGMNYIRFLKIGNPHRLKKMGIQIGGGGHNILFRFMDPNQEYPYRHTISGGEGKPEDPYPVGSEYVDGADGGRMLTYAGAHPEWYAWIDGKRSCRRDYELAKTGYYTGDNICTSDPHAVEELCRLLVEDLISGEWSHLDYLDFWMLDNGKWCECENCKKSGNLTSRLLAVVHSLAGAIGKAHADGRLKRELHIFFPAYHETLPVPDRQPPEDFDYDRCHVAFFPIERCYVHFIDDGQCTETNRKLHDSYLQWTDREKGNYKGDILVGEYYNVSSFAAMPFVLKRMIAHDIPFYYKTGTRHFYYMHMTSGAWGMLAINNYLYARLLWDPFADTDRLVKEYLALYYPKTHKEMESFYDRLEQAMANCKYLKHYQAADGKIISLFSAIRKCADDFFPLKHIKYDRRIDDPNAGISLVETLEQLGGCRRLLNAALLGAGEGMEAERLLEDDMRLLYGECMLNFLHHLVCTCIFKNTGRDKAAEASYTHARLYGEQLRRMTVPLSGYRYGEEMKNGLTASWVDDAYEKLAEMYGKR